MHALVFGGSGALGSAVVEVLRLGGWDVDVAGRSPSDAVTIDVTRNGWASDASRRGSYDGVVWAQGLNAAGGALDTTSEVMRDLYEANVIFFVQTLQHLVAAGALSTPARGVVLSSVWQITARANKLAYVASKAALAGAIPAIAADMAPQGFAINAVLPGVVDSPMTRANLTAAQLKNVESATLGGSLATPADVGRAVAWLLGPGAEGINAQSIVVDNGWSSVRSA